MSIDYESDGYHKKRHSDLIESPQLREAWAAFAKLAYFSDLKPQQRVLEFGAGLGNNLIAIAKTTYVAAVEPSSLGRQIASEYGVDCYRDLDSLPPGTFDIILCRHVLEHVEEPKKILQLLRNRLSPSGRLILVLPIDPVDQEPKEQDLNNHLYCWNARTGSNLLKLCGFKQIHYRYETFGAKRRLLPLYTYLGSEVYAKAVRQCGRLFRFRELVLEAQSATE